MTTTTAFVFGILVVIGIAILAAIVMSLVKAIKTERKLEEFIQTINQICEKDYLHFESLNQDRIIDIERLSECIYKDMENHINYIHKRIEDLDKDSCNELGKVKSNFDSRIDKLIDKTNNIKMPQPMSTLIQLKHIIISTEYSDKHKIELLKNEIEKLIN